MLASGMAAAKAVHCYTCLAAAGGPVTGGPIAGFQSIGAAAVHCYEEQTMSKTLENLRAAFAGESQAAIRTPILP